MLQRPSRPRLLIIAAVTLLAAGTAIFLWRSHRAASAAELVAGVRRPDAALLYLDLHTLRQSGILSKLAGSAATQDPEYKAFVTQTGFDYTRDLDEAVFSVSPRENRFLLKGRFDKRHLQDYAVRNGGSCSGDLCRTPSSKPERTISFRLLSPGLLALAVSSDPLAAAGLKPGEANTQDPLPKDPLWLSLPGELLREQERIPAGTRLFAHALQDADNVLFTAGALPDGKLEISMKATCRTEEQAAILRAQLESVTELLRKLIAREKQQPNPNDLSSSLLKGRFERQARHVVARWPVDPALLDTLVGVRPRG